MLLSQILELGLMPYGLAQATVAALVLSMLVAPLIVQVSDRLVMRFVASEWLLRSMELTRVAAQSLNTERHIIVCGYGRSGQYLARFLEQENVAYVALDLDPERVREAGAAVITVGAAAGAAAADDEPRMALKKSLAGSSTITSPLVRKAER